MDNEAPVAVTPVTPAEPVAPVTPEGALADATPRGDDAGLANFMSELKSLSDASNVDMSAIEHTETPAEPAPTPEVIPEPVPVAPPPPIQPAASAPEELVNRARQVGILPDEARMYPPEALERTVLIFERNLERIQSHLNQTAPDRPGQQPSAAPVQPPPSEEFVLNLDDQFHDPEVVAAVRGMHSHYEKQIRELKEIVAKVAPQLESVVQQNQAQAREQFVRQFDSGLDQLGEEYHDLFGTNAQERHVNKNFLQNAHDVLREMNIQSQGFLASGLPIPPVAELQQRAINVLHAGRAQERAKKAAQDRVAQQLRDQRGQFLQRPNDAQSLGRKDAKAEALAELAAALARENSSNGRY